MEEKYRAANGMILKTKNAKQRWESKENESNNNN